MPLEHHDALIEDINQLLSLESNSVFAETYAKLAEKSIREAKTLQKVLNSDETALANEFSHNYISMQLKQVAKLIAARRAEGKERDVFFVGVGGRDTHGELDDVVALKWAEVNAALSSFTAEMKALNLWKNVTVTMGSDFGRAHRGNGQGSESQIHFKPTRHETKACFCEAHMISLVWQVTTAGAAIRSS